ncbi:cytochrome-c peroxidase, partial [Pseudomonas syringae pv. actinidiae]|nr:cytochrome-c peroxidase [Pseudomonas syringae pv. actinidiae]
VVHHRQSSRELGRLGVAQLLQRMSGSECTQDVTRVAVELVCRGTVATRRD